MLRASVLNIHTNIRLGNENCKLITDLSQAFFFEMVKNILRKLNLI